ncbi:type III-B CRISPR module-associated Cmr3 family protein [Rhodoferax sp.]|uniref:type III-B CRISPR module-associated Cmr3 family protein n=1 Tax=Rhodoferax sp. TaxID=50421 RepID=UPI00275A60AB|nr:type III-B CRISPR module-associated Cmr3 family protein [Rhodoferax sp.]
MSATTYFYVRPTDSLFIRGNLAFGDSGEHGASQMPPPPSLFAGAFRSAILGQDVKHLAQFLAGQPLADEARNRCLGTYAQPGAFRVSWLSLAGQANGQAVPEAVSPLPADLVVLGKAFAPLIPQALSAGVSCSGDLPMRATLYSAKQEKPSTGIYLRGTGLQDHLSGKLPGHAAQAAAGHVFRRDPRLGIGLNADSRTAEQGLIYTTEGYAFSPGEGVEGDEGKASPFASTGFLVGMEGVADVLPALGNLRLGGDGRSATYQRVEFKSPTADGPAANKRFRLVLQSPALFRQGWLPDGVVQQDGLYKLQGAGFSARLACAAIGRREVVSGWDLHGWKPKPAQAAAPAGSVYWFDEFEGDAGKLAAWVQSGLWPENLAAMDTTEKMRRAEGYNLALLATWI